MGGVMERKLDPILQDILQRHKRAFMQGFLCGMFATFAVLGAMVLIW
jgi:hypothetical protein